MDFIILYGLRETFLHPVGPWADWKGVCAHWPHCAQAGGSPWFLSCLKPSSARPLDLIENPLVLFPLPHLLLRSTTLLA